MACAEDCQPLILADVEGGPHNSLPRVPRIPPSVGVTSQRNPSAYSHKATKKAAATRPGTVLTCDRASVTFWTWGSPRTARDAHAYMHAWNRSFMGSVLVVETLKSSILSLLPKISALIVVRCAPPPRPFALAVATLALFFCHKRPHICSVVASKLILYT